MKIAHLLPASAVFPLKKHNGRYEWALRLARLQTNAGHEVTIFAGSGSTDNSTIIWRSIENAELNKKQRNLALLEAAFSDGHYDIFHSHFDALHYFVADKTDKPVIVTQHWFPTQEFADAVHFNTRGNVIAVPVTKLMQAEDGRLGIPSTHHIYHGIDLSLFSFNETPGDRFLFVGRIHPNKGVADALHYAIKAGIKLDIIGKVNHSEETFWQELQPFVDGETIRYLGPKTLNEVALAYQQAKALIFPSRQAEAFGQVTIEAKACGTPVIISEIGASNELVQHGKTGFVCRNENEFIEAIHSINAINRSDCRDFAEQFNITDMVVAYTSLYESALSSIDSTLV